MLQEYLLKTKQKAELCRHLFTKIEQRYDILTPSAGGNKSEGININHTATPPAVQVSEMELTSCCSLNAYYKDENTALYLGDNREVLPYITDESIDLIVTDPQYGWSFMGKEWDKAVPSIETWRQCFRVLKPGAFAFIMSGARLDCLVENGIRIREAGFDISFTPIFWAYASGFPKAMNIKKAVMKKLGDEGVVVGKEMVDVGIQCGSMHAGRESKIEERNIVEPTIPEAIALSGSYAGFQPKPAVEVIIVAMKPLSEKMYVEQALGNRKGITWMDDCRIPLQEVGEDPRLGGKGIPRGTITSSPEGRFPANILVSDDVLNDGTASKGGGSIYNPASSRFSGRAYNSGVAGGDRHGFPGYPDSGSFSRYFDLDRWFEERIKKLPENVIRTFPFLIVPKASKSERDEGVEDVEVEIGHNRFDKCKICGGTIFQNPDRSSACKCVIPVREPNKVKGNFHPTVKPLDLMSYLITLGSRERDVVLDPFCGSGTTLIAASMLSRRSIGIDIEEEYLKHITVPRLKEFAKQKTLFNFGADANVL